MFGEAFVVLMIVGVIVSWILAGVRGYSLGKSHGMILYFAHMAGAIGLVLVLWLAIVYPTFGCSGFLCGLDEMILWSIVSMIVMLVWPLILITLFRRKWPVGEKPKKLLNEELLDDDLA